MWNQSIKVNKELKFFYATQFLENNNNNWPLSHQNVEYLSLHLIVHSIAVFGQHFLYLWDFSILNFDQRPLIVIILLFHCSRLQKLKSPKQNKPAHLKKEEKKWTY